MKQKERPDHGRAWLIAFAACIINMILSGISRMIGMLFVAVIDVYGVSRQEATMPFSVRNSIRCLAGPLVGMVGLHFKIRTITFFGGVIATLGACLCSIAPSLMWLTIFWGVIHALGFAFANTLFQVVVNQYFEKHRATASGIALSGACFGSLVFPFMFDLILKKYELNGAFLLLGGLVMNVLPPSLLLVSPPWIKEENKQKNISTNSDHSPNAFDDVPEKIEEDDVIKDLRSCRVLHSQSFCNCPTEGMEIASIRRSSSFCSRKQSRTRADSFEKNSNGELKCSSLAKKDTFCVLKVTPEEDEVNGSNIFTVENSSLGSQAQETNITNVPDNMKSTNPQSQKKANAIMTSIIKMGKLYLNPAFVLISICMVAYIIIFIPMLTVIVDYSTDKGLPDEDGKFLISGMAFGDLIGRLGFGWVTDRGIMTISNFMMTSLLLQGITVIMFPLAQSFYTLMGLLILYGMTAGSVLILFPILVLRHVTMDDQPIAMGCVGFLSGMVTFGLPPFIGHFRDHVGSYDGMFYVTASFSILSGILWLLEPVVSKYKLKTSASNAAKS